MIRNTQQLSTFAQKNRLEIKLYYPIRDISAPI